MGYNFSGSRINWSSVKLHLGLGESIMLQKRQSKFIPIAFFIITTFGLTAIILSWVSRQQQVPQFGATHSPYAVTLTADSANRDYLTHLDMQRITSTKETEWSIDSKLAEKALGKTLPESIKHVKTDASPATLLQVLKGDAKIEMERDGDSVRFGVVKPNPYLQVD